MQSSILILAISSLSLGPLQAWLKDNFDEKSGILEKKAFDTLRGLLPMATLGQVARGRADLLAESAGLAIGGHEGDRDEARYLQAAQLCIDAGADLTTIPDWIEEGRRRAGAASPAPTRHLRRRRLRGWPAAVRTPALQVS